MSRRQHSGRALCLMAAIAGLPAPLLCMGSTLRQDATVALEQVAAKLALLPAPQENATSLTTASQQVNDTKQQTQAQAMAAPEQAQQQTQEAGVRSIGARVG